MGETMNEGILVLVVGLVVVFSVLALLWLIIGIFKVIFSNTNNDRKKTAVSETKKEVVSTNYVPVEDESSKKGFGTSEDVCVEGESDSETIAVISAAVAATLDVAPNKFVIKSIKKV